MLALELLRWWYGPGLIELFRRIRRSLRTVLLTFSVPILLRTLFSPWRRIISYGDNSFIEGLKAMLDNAVSRFVGFGVRVIVLIVALIILVIGLVIGLVAVIAWPLLPLASAFLVLKGIWP